MPGHTLINSREFQVRDGFIHHIVLWNARSFTSIYAMEMVLVGLLITGWVEGLDKAPCIWQSRGGQFLP